MPFPNPPADQSHAEQDNTIANQSLQHQTPNSIKPNMDVHGMDVMLPNPTFNRAVSCRNIASDVSCSDNKRGIANASGVACRDSNSSSANIDGAPPIMITPVGLNSRNYKHGGNFSTTITPMHRSEISKTVYQILRCNLPSPLREETTQTQLMLISRAVERKLYATATSSGSNASSPQAFRTYTDKSTIELRIAALATAILIHAESVRQNRQGQLGQQSETCSRLSAAARRSLAHCVTVLVSYEKRELEKVVRKRMEEQYGDLQEMRQKAYMDQFENCEDGGVSGAQNSWQNRGNRIEHCVDNLASAHNSTSNLMGMPSINIDDSASMCQNSLADFTPRAQVPPHSPGNSTCFGEAIFKEFFGDAQSVSQIDLDDSARLQRRSEE
mmetsp:Transcript_31705/g.66354  ORF Transcript_31705/g.66354 Transcript_31705/m.66354 type:complete len:385 (-) Transcript_31705:30-1184(-)